jgi:hypothetical protein
MVHDSMEKKVATAAVVILALQPFVGLGLL